MSSVLMGFILRDKEKYGLIPTKAKSGLVLRSPSLDKLVFNWSTQLAILVYSWSSLTSKKTNLIDILPC